MKNLQPRANDERPPFATVIGAHYLDDVRRQFVKLKAQAERAMADVADDAFFRTPDHESNSIAIVVKHVAGNMRSRWLGGAGRHAPANHGAWGGRLDAPVRHAPSAHA